jgi:hypothetical protein
LCSIFMAYMALVTLSLTRRTLPNAPFPSTCETSISVPHRLRPPQHCRSHLEHVEIVGAPLQLLLLEDALPGVLRACCRAFVGKRIGWSWAPSSEGTGGGRRLFNGVGGRDDSLLEKLALLCDKGWNLFEQMKACGGGAVVGRG